MDLAPRMLERIVKEVPSLQRVKLQGMGEPFLHPRILDLIGTLAGKGIEVSTVTNGVWPKSVTAEQATASGLKQLSFSVDTLVPEVYRHIRGADRLSEVFRNLEECAKTASNNLQVGTMTVVLRENQADLLTLTGRLIEMGVRTLGFQADLTSWGKSEWNRNLNPEMDPEKTEEQLEAVADLCQKHAIPLEIIHNRFLAPGQPCAWPFHRPYITAEGTILPCCKLSDPTIMPLGSLQKKSFARIWNAHPYRRLREQFRKNEIPDPCKMCYCPPDH